MKHLSQTILVGFVSFLVVVTTLYAPFSNLYFGTAPTTHAVLGVGDTAFEVNPVVVGGIAATAVNTTLQTTGTAPKNILDALAWMVAKTAVNSITRSTVNWINSGFQGSPAFVSDLKANLRDLGDAVADDFLDHLDQTVYDATGFNITTPFQDQLNQVLRQEYYRTTASWGLDYNLYQKSNDPKAFLAGDFNKGGFDAYLSASLNPANNPFGAYREASNALWQQVGAAAQQRKTELDWGKGFLPWRGNCNKPSADKTVALKNSKDCLFNSVKTPGSVIEAQLEHSLGTGIRQLELADSINEIVGALIGQLVNQVLGAGGLIGASQPSAGGGGSFIDRATSASTTSSQSASLASGVLQNIQSDRASITSYRDSWQKILDAALAAQQSCHSNDSDVNNVVVQASAATAKGNAALAKLTIIEGKVQAATQAGSADSTQVISVVTEYQSFLTANTTPTGTEVQNAAIQASDDSSSLYSQMRAKANPFCR